MEYKAETHLEASGKSSAQVWAYRDGVLQGCVAYLSPFDSRRAALYAAKSIALQVPGRVAIPLNGARQPAFLWPTGEVIR